MKAFFPRAPFSARFSPLLSMAAFSFLLPSLGFAGDDPTVAGALIELRKAPVFTSPLIPLAKTWGSAIPVGTEFQVEKVYGRWVFGHPLPLRHMRTQDYSPSGWIFSRSLLIPGDSDTIPASVVQQSRSVLYHARPAWKKLGLGAAGHLLGHSAETDAAKELYSTLDFLESLTLSKKTLMAFSYPERPPASSSASWIPEALAADDAPSSTLGLTGSDLSFLDQEIKVVQERKKREAKAKESKHLRIPPPPPIDDKTRTGLLGRYMLERYLELPALSMEEVDGHIYMRAVAMRALHGCALPVQNYWKNRRWGYFRVFRLKSRPEVKHPWFEIALPGGYFALSGRAIELAGNEAELAFVLVRQLVRELRVKRSTVRFNKKGWPDSLQSIAEERWDQVLKAQSTKDSENLDVADEIAVDSQAIECISKSGYRPMAAIAYLHKLALHKEDPWAAWYSQHSIGLDYRIERVTTLLQESIAQEKYPEGQDSREKRFASAAKQWNILP